MFGAVLAVSVPVCSGRILRESQRRELIEIDKKVNAVRRSHSAEHGGEEVAQLPTKADIARMTEIRLHSGSNEADIIQAMGVDRGTLNHYITRQLGLKWKTAWTCDGRTGRYAKAATLTRSGPLPGCAPAAAPAVAGSWADPVGQLPAGLRPSWHSPSPASRIVPGGRDAGSYGTARQLQYDLPGPTTVPDILDEIREEMDRKWLEDVAGRLGVKAE
jgi:hypothetical protein